MSDEDITIEPNPDPPPDESPFEIQPLDVQERSLDSSREIDGD